MNAAILWQQGRKGEVAQYCNHDCYLTALLYEKICQEGGLVSPKLGTLVSMRAPQEEERA